MKYQQRNEQIIPAAPEQVETAAECGFASAELPSSPVLPVRIAAPTTARSVVRSIGQAAGLTIDSGTSLFEMTERALEILREKRIGLIRLVDLTEFDRFATASDEQLCCDLFRFLIQDRGIDLVIDVLASPVAPPAQAHLGGRLRVMNSGDGLAAPANPIGS